MNKVEDKNGFIRINCESFVFVIEDTIDIFELNDLKTTETDEKLFGEFKEKLTKENVDIDEFDFDLDMEENQETDNEFEDNITPIAELTLEQAVIDFTNNENVEAFNHIYNHYKPILNRWGKRYNNEELGIELLDIVVLSAVKTYKNGIGTKFNTYFWKCAKNYINCDRKKNDAQKRAHNKNMASLNEKKSYNGNSEMELEKTVEDKSSTLSSKTNELVMSIKGLNEHLKENEILILLKLIDNYTLQEIGDDLGITAAAVCMSLKRIAKKPAASKKLKEILSN